MPQIVASIDQARTAGLDVSANVYAYPASANDLSAFLLPWAHDGGDPCMLERLRDPSARKRLREAMSMPDTSWDNEWQEIRDPRRC